MRKTHNGNGAVGVCDDLPGYRADEPALEDRMAAMTEDDMIDRMLFRIPHKLLGGMPDDHFEMGACGP